MAANPFARVLEALHDNGVRYVVAGGFAAVMHGCNRFTADLDLIVDLAPEEARKAVATLSGLGLKPRVPVDPFAFADAATRQQWARDKGMQVFTFTDPDVPAFSVDLFIEPPDDFEQLRARATVLSYHGRSLPICGLDDLIALKKAAGRPQDAADIRDLEQIRDRRETP